MRQALPCPGCADPAPVRAARLRSGSLVARDFVAETGGAGRNARTMARGIRGVASAPDGGGTGSVNAIRAVVSQARIIHRRPRSGRIFEVAGRARGTGFWRPLLPVRQFRWKQEWPRCVDGDGASRRTVMRHVGLVFACFWCVCASAHFLHQLKALNPKRFSWKH